MNTPKPLVDPAVISWCLVIFEHKIGRCVPRLVGIETVHPKEEVLPVCIVPQKLGGGCEKAAAIPILGLLAFSIGAQVRVFVDPTGVFTELVAQRIFKQILRQRCTVINPWAVDLSASYHGPRVKGIVEVVAAVYQMWRIVDKLSTVAFISKYPG